MKPYRRLFTILFTLFIIFTPPPPQKYETHTKIVFFMIYIHHSEFFLHREILMKCCFWHNKGAPRTK